MRVLLIRHGKDDGRFRGGWSQLDLIPEGIAQAEKLAGYLKDHADSYHIRKIISSDLPRTLTTANIIARELELPVQKDRRLREINNGELAGMHNKTALKRYPGLFFNTLAMDEPYPGGESPRAFYERISRWFDAFCEDCRTEEGDIAVVTHGGVINIVCHLVNKIPWSNQGKSFKTDYCSLYILNMESMTFEEKNLKTFLF